MSSSKRNLVSDAVRWAMAASVEEVEQLVTTLRAIQQARADKPAGKPRAVRSVAEPRSEAQ